MTELRRETIQTHYMRVTLTPAHVGEGYRLQLSRRRIPVVNGEDTWTPDYRWDLPADGLTEEEVKSRIAHMNADARERYERDCEQIEQMRETADARHEAHEEPPLTGTLKTEERRGGGTMNWIE